MIVRTPPRSRRFASYGDTDPCASLDWEEYCDCMYANDPTNRVKCKTKPWSCCPFGICPPWASPKSAIGQGCRGIPKTQSGAGIDFLYAVSTGMETISAVDKLMVVKQQTGAIQSQEVAVAEQARLDQQAIIDQANAAETREKIIKYAQWGGVALAGVLVVSVAVRALSPSRPAQVKS